jgi:hypothetical protein
MPYSGEFEGALQTLIADFFQQQDQSSEEDVVDSFQRIFVSLAHELGRVDAAARLHGVTREESLDLLRACMEEGKRATLSQHKKSCECEASKVLQAEVDTN